MTTYVHSLNLALQQLLTDPKVLVIGEDIVDPYGGAFKATRGLSTKFQDRVITTPVSEAGIVGLASGLAMRGFKPIVEIMFGDFLTLAADQLVNGASKFASMYNHQVHVPMVVRTPVGGYRGYGPTHSQCLEHMFFSIPGLTIVAPSHVHNPGAELTRAVNQSYGVTPVLFLEHKSLYPQKLAGEGSPLYEVTNVDGTYYGTKRLRLRGAGEPHMTVFAYGGMVPLVMQAGAQAFERAEVVVEIVAPAQVTPIEEGGVLRVAQGRALVVEEAPFRTGWGAALVATIEDADHHTLRQPVGRLGAQLATIPAGIEQEKEVLPQVDDITQSICTLCQ